MILLDDVAGARDHQRLQWARGVLDDDAIGLERASVDAGFRSYWRTIGSARSAIVMDSPPGLEDVRPWLRMRALLQAGGVRVPQVQAEDSAEGFLLLEDLGAKTYLQCIDTDNADAMFDAAIAQLLKIQAIAPPVDLPAYDTALLTRDLRLFDEWFLRRHLGLVLDDADQRVLDDCHALLIDAALAQPRVLVHRDFMPRNLMPADDGPAVLDFQDAVLGPIAYDVISLFKDAFLSWPESRVTGWIAGYHRRAVATGLPVPGLETFRRDADWIGVQRHLKIIGIFARLQHRDGKANYLQDIPRFLGYLETVLPRYPELTALDAFINAKVKPAMSSSIAG
ncbi:MAG: aminoglycoside phosphotransferase [Xanthomonadaceae bacterium]|nr:aminoglycoside phosphotransferase [Xanthomonadaceae bacterium]